MPVSKKQIAEILAKQSEMEEVLGTFIGGYLGGPPGAVLGRGAVELHQRSPSHWLEQEIARRAPAVIENFMARRMNPTPGIPATRKRKASAYSKRYGAAFKKLSPRYKKKSGGWKKNGFKNCGTAARRLAKK